MELFQAWTGLLQSILQTPAVDWGFGFGMAVIVLTIATRVALLPLSWSLARRGALR
jgi:membrane protein insertase Oxa1/YidC/SpoIIIJ